MSPTDRRQFLTGASVAVAACCGLAGCAGAAEPQPGTPFPSGGDPTGRAGTGSASSSNPGSSKPGGGVSSSVTSGGGPVDAPTIPKADVPVGGGAVLTDSHVVVVQPEAGSYRAYTSICTHQGCDVARVEENVIVCDCHGSRFSATDGSVKNGPATSPLGLRTVSENGDSLVIQP